MNIEWSDPRNYWSICDCLSIYFLSLFFFQWLLASWRVWFFVVYKSSHRYPIPKSTYTRGIQHGCYRGEYVILLNASEAWKNRLDCNFIWYLQFFCLFYLFFLFLGYGNFLYSFPTQPVGWPLFKTITGHTRVGSSLGSMAFREETHKCSKCRNSGVLVPGPQKGDMDWGWAHLWSYWPPHPVGPGRPKQGP